MTSLQNEAAGEGPSATARRAALVKASLIGLWVCAALALVLLVWEVARAGHWTWDIWVGVIGELIAVPLFMGLDILAARFGSTYWLSRIAPSLPLLALAAEGYPRPGVSVADWIPVQAVLLLILAGAYMPTRALILARIAATAELSGDGETADPRLTK